MQNLSITTSEFSKTDAPQSPTKSSPSKSSEGVASQKSGISSAQEGTQAAKTPHQDAFATHLKSWDGSMTINPKTGEATADLRWTVTQKMSSNTLASVSKAGQELCLNAAKEKKAAAPVVADSDENEENEGCSWKTPFSCMYNGVACVLSSIWNGISAVFNLCTCYCFAAEVKEDAEETTTPAA